MVEAVEKYSASTEPTNNNPTTQSPDNGEEPEEGEIVTDDESTNQSTAVIAEPHPLEHSWTFWFDNPSAKSKQAAWGSSICPVYTFSTIEQFWGLYNNIHHPSKLAVGADFHCFKNNIEPKWEDPVCANGGKWTVSFQRGKSDTCWLYTLLAMIGEQFDHGDEICGAVVNVRARQEKIALWTKNAANEVAQEMSDSFMKLTNYGRSNRGIYEQDFNIPKLLVSIGRQLKEFLDSNDSIGFIFHDDARKLDRAAKNRYTV